jgi:2-polyprenyl-3-methyl-5-hydroxy-6-metoxy-1,4-benzoquinol methylase
LITNAPYNNMASLDQTAKIPQQFDKYHQKGAYHYNATIGAKNWRQFDPRLYARYLRAIWVLNPKRGETILDAGSGEGVASILCCHRGATVKAVEFDKHALKLGEDLRRTELINEKQLEFVPADLYALPMCEKTFDKVISLEVIEHMSDLNSYLTEIERVMKNGGLCVFTTPMRQESGQVQDPYHVQEFNHEELKRELEKTFVDVKVGVCWSRGVESFYLRNGCLKKISKIKRALIKLLARVGLNLFLIPIPRNSGVGSILIASCRKRV